MVRASRIAGILIVGVLLLAMLAPGASLGSQPVQPVNAKPYDGAVDIPTRTTLWFSYADPDTHTMLAAWVQISESSATLADGSYTTTAFDSGPVDASSGDDLDVIPLGAIQPSTKYYWHVKTMDEYGYWSVWSATTSFTTVKIFAPDQPENYSPSDGQNEISPDQKLVATPYYDCDGDVQYAARWQVAASGAHELSADGSYVTPLFDSATDPGNKQQIAMPVGVVDFGLTYYWHVKYQDDQGLWSPWSAETSFTLVKNLAPSSPMNIEPANGAAGTSTAPILKASEFSDFDATAYVALTDKFSAAQWQVTAAAGDYASPVWDSGEKGAAATSAAVPAGELEGNKTYYWHVRYCDSYGNWSGWSVETSFTTKAIPQPVAAFSADKTAGVIAGEEYVTFTDNSTPAGEIVKWSWDFGDGTTENWTNLTRPASGQVLHRYTKTDKMDVTLTVWTSVDNYNALPLVDYIEVIERPQASFTAPASAKAKKDVTFTADVSGASYITSWVWDFGDGSDAVQWTNQTAPANGGITHKFKKAGTYVVSLTIKGPLSPTAGDTYNKTITVTGGKGFHFELWMILVAIAVVVVLAGVVYLVQARRTKK